MTAETHASVLLRDGMCVAAKLDHSHVCRDKWGEQHAATALGVMTVEHVREAAGGKRYHDAFHLLAMCHSGNAQEHWGAANRDLCRAYLAGVKAASA